MVRLKDITVNRGDWKEYISIPYGAIKRALTFLLKHAIIVFQFLMVRLKDRIVIININKYIRISIPYGAIKR